MKHRLFPSAVVACAVAFAFVALLTHILQRHDAQYPFRGIEIMATDAEIHYSARTREIYDGFRETGNTFYSEPKDQPYLQPPYPEMVPATIASWLHVDPVLAFTGFAGLCAFILLIVMTGAVAALTGRRWESLLAVCALLFVGFLLGAPWDLGKFLAAIGGFEPLRFTRPINPLWTAPWFFGAVWLIAAWVRTNDKRLLAACVVTLTVLVYSYVYAWSYLAVALALLTAAYAVQRDWKRVRSLCACGVTVGVLSIPYVLHLLETSRNPLYADSSLRLGLVQSHAPLLGVWTVIGLVIVAATYKRWRTTWPLVAALIVGGILAMNQQVITGHSIVPHHYHWYFFHPLASLLTMVFILQTLNRFAFRGCKRGIVGLLLVFVIVFGVRYQELAYVTARAYWGEQQKLAPVIAYIGAHLHAGQVVYSPSIDVLDITPIYTSADVYTASNANNYLVPTERARSVFFFDLWVKGLTAEQAEQQFPTTMRSRLGSALYAIYFREQYGSYDAVPDDVVVKTLVAYREYLKLSDREKVSMYPVDAIVLPTGTKETPAIVFLKKMSDEVLSVDGYTVRIIKKGQ